MSNLILYLLSRGKPTEETNNSNTWPHIISFSMVFQEQKEKLRQIHVNTKSQTVEKTVNIWRGKSTMVYSIFA